MVKSSSINSFTWAFADLLFNKAGHFLFTFYLASDVGPQEFALVGIAYIFLAVGNSFIDGGLSISLIKSDKLLIGEYETIYTTNIALSVLTYFVIFLSADFSESFFNIEGLGSFLKFYCLGFIISSIRSIYLVKFIRQRDFKRIALMNVPGSMLSLLVAFFVVNFDLGVWSLASLYVSNQLISTVIYVWKSKYLFRLRFDFSIFKKHFLFGYKLFLASQINIIFENINSAIIGRLHIPKQLSYYDRANSLNSFPMSIFSTVLQKVLLPESVLRNSKNEDISSFFRQNQKMIIYLVGSFTAISYLNADYFVEIFLGDSWLSVSDYYKALCFAYVLFPIHANCLTLMNFFGRSDYFLKGEIIKKTFLALYILLLFSFGISGLILASILSSFTALLINFFFVKLLLEVRLYELLYDLIPTVLVIGTTSAAVFLISPFLVLDLKLLTMIITVFIFVAIELFLSDLFRLSPYLKLREMFSIKL